jgi:hypothetical protein
MYTTGTKRIHRYNLILILKWIERKIIVAPLLCPKPRLLCTPGKNSSLATTSWCIQHGSRDCISVCPADPCLYNPPAWMKHPSKFNKHLSYYSKLWSKELAVQQNNWTYQADNTSPIIFIILRFIRTATYYFSHTAGNFILSQTYIDSANRFSQSQQVLLTAKGKPMKKKLKFM